ncbi:MAG: glucose-6-phosphate 1-dehydrogenase [Thermodesulfobacteriota bacterium]|nr:glucose-6-phosphate 1-dehydrogenase [Thermodesulfobacteriota bacterium]
MKPEDEQADPGLLDLGTATTGTERSMATSIGEKDPESFTLVIIGASGDLTERKIVPALFDLYRKGEIPAPFRVVGCARTHLDDQGFREKMRKALGKKTRSSDAEWKAFAERLHYWSIDYSDESSFVALGTFLNSGVQGQGMAQNRIFYLAIPPSLCELTVGMIGRSGLAAEGTEGYGWSRIVIEKPFGRDLKSAAALDRSLHEHFNEHQIFRMDHYLAKETVQNILMFRFANAIFEPIWNRRYVDSVTIRALETLGVEHRAGYYEQAGVLRDMFQNHMMQLLALMAMDPPSAFEADRVRDEKVRVYRSLRPFPVGRLNDYLILGQYGPGVVRGKEVPGYREEPGVRPTSLIPTFASMRVFIDNWRWQGTPFYLTSGKRMGEKVTNITIQFKEVPHSVFRNVLGEHIAVNCLTMGIYPDERISLMFQTKHPGPRVSLTPVTMDFRYAQGQEDALMEAYEKLLLDCMLGDQMLFLRQDSVELCWSFLTPILNACETCSDRSEMLLFYESGTLDAEAVERLNRTRMVGI